MSDPLAPITAQDWYRALPQPAVTGDWDGAFSAALRCYAGGAPDMQQPALSDHVLAIHMGGPKRIRRWQGGGFQAWDVEQDSITLMPAFRSNRWLTEGPVAYAHLALSPGLLARLSREEFDRDPGGLTLRDRVGLVDPLVSQLLLALVADVAAPGPRLLRDSLLACLTVTVLRRHSSLPDVRPLAAGRRPLARGGLAGWQLRRVVDHMAQHLAEDIGAVELAALTGLSRAQFFRAFRQSTGQPPHRYLLTLRMEHARQLLRDPSRTVGSVARAAGFQSASQFAGAFRRATGASPAAWRREA